MKDMKKTLASRLETASTKIKAAENKVWQHPFTSILSLCVLAGVAATVITYSQTPKAPVAGAVALTLPADNVELIDVNGRRITVTVLSKNATGIVIRTNKGKEIAIQWHKLSEKTTKLLAGNDKIVRKSTLTPDTPATYSFRDSKWNSRTEKVVRIEEKQIIINKDGKEVAVTFDQMSPYSSGFFQGKTVEETERDIERMAINNRIRGEAERARINREFEFSRNSPITEEYSKMDAKAAAEFLMNPPTEDAKRIVNTKKIWWDTISKTTKRYGWVTQEEMAPFFVYPIEILGELDLENRPLNEKVSLRPEFEKYGIAPMHQSFNELGCQYQTCYKLTNFWLSRKGQKKLSLSEFWQLGSHTLITQKGSFTVMIKMDKSGTKAIMGSYFGTLFAAATGTQPKRMHLVTGNRALSYELAKHMLRNGRPIAAEVPSKIATRHMVAIVGFETIDGTTRFEVLDHNYHWEPNLLLISDTWAVWFE